MTKRKVPIALRGKHLRRGVREYADWDQKYLDSLSDEELAWLAEFSREYYLASFDKSPGRSKNRGERRRKEIYRNNYMRNNDVFSQCERVWGDADSIVDDEDEK